VSRDFIFVRFEFIEASVTQTYFPYLTVIYAILLVYLLLQKQKRYALIYGFAVVLVAKLYYLNELYALNGTFTSISKSGYFLKQIMVEDSIVAQDVTLTLLIVLTGIKIMIYVHDYYIMNKKNNDSLRQNI
jgi:predicted neutral ceramidase superfamily lipid hydrolase